MIKVYLIKTDLKSNAEISDLAWAHVLQLASQDLHMPKESITVKKGLHGKPYFDGYSEWQFNISHTSGMIAIAVSDKPVGIDIEKIQKQDLRIAERYFTDAECNYINEADSDDDKNKRLLEVWTKKEAYLKFTGEGMSRPISSFSVIDIPAKNQTMYWDGYILSVCCSSQVDSELSVEYCTDGVCVNYPQCG